MTISMGEIIARFKSCILGFLRAKTWDPVKNGPSQNTLCHPRFLSLEYLDNSSPFHIWGFSEKGNGGSRRVTEGAVTGIGPLLIARTPFNCTCGSYGLIADTDADAEVRADPLRKAQFVGLGQS